MSTGKTKYIKVKTSLLMTLLLFLSSCKEAHKQKTSVTNAVIDDDRVVIQNFLNKQADVHEKETTEGWTPLHYAAHQGSLEIAELLCKHGADVNERSKTSDDSAYRDIGNTPLHAAIMGNQLSMAKYLIAHGAHVHESNNDGNTPLHLAVMQENVPMVEYLLSLGTPITDHINDCNDHKIDGNTPLTLARKQNHKELMKLLHKYGANINEPRCDGTTVLMDAVKNDDFDMASYWLNQGADVDITDVGGRTALHYAAYKGNVKIAQLLLKHQANIDENAWGGGGSLAFCGSPLMVATQEGHNEMVAFLLAQGADINVQDELMEETAMDIAQQKGDPILIELLSNIDSYEKS